MYKFAAGFNNTGGLTAVSIQPQSDGIQYQRKMGNAPSAYEDTPFAIWRYKSILTIEEYRQLLEEFGLTTNLMAECTVSTTIGENYSGATRQFVNKNAIIWRPQLVDDARFQAVAGWYNSVEFMIWIY